MPTQSSLLRILGRVLAMLLVLSAALVVLRTIYAPSLQSRYLPFSEANLLKHFRSNFDRSLAEKRLSRAIQFPTISIRTDQAWELQSRSSQAFADFHKFLQSAYPAVFAKLEWQVVPPYSLLLRWVGNSPTKKPILLLAHQDVVPAPTSETPWQEEPFSGKITETDIWGRGALDDKSTILALLNTIEWLIAQNFRPERDVYFAFGYDEEIGGNDGARKIAGLLGERKISFAFILDEGGVLYPGKKFGIEKNIALIGIAEKGFTDISLTVSDPGGHSSMPPKRTAIGKMAQAIVALDDRGFPAKIGGAFDAMLTSLAPEMNFLFRMAVRNRWLMEPLLEFFFAQSPNTNAFLRTSHSANIIEGGDASNALPNSVHATINLRLIPGDSISEARDYIESVIRGSGISDVSVSLKNSSAAAAATNLSSHENNYFRYLGSVVRSTFANSVVTPYLVLGGTDARHYGALSENIYRFLPTYVSPDLLQTMHGVNERIPRTSFLQMHEFYLQLFSNLNSLKD